MKTCRFQGLGFGILGFRVEDHKHQGLLLRVDRFCFAAPMRFFLAACWTNFLCYKIVPSEFKLRRGLGMDVHSVIPLDHYC